HGASLLYQFNLLPEQGHKRPAFINLQQFHAEAYLVDRVQELSAVDLRWRNKVIGLEPRNDHGVGTIEAPDGSYRMRASYGGARGANSGLEDAENLAWKLDRVLKRISPEALLESYHVERSAAADENIRESTRSTDFMAPGSRQEARLRQAVLSLARETEFGKRMINGGRLSVPSIYDSPLSSADCDAWRGGPPPGASMLDAPIAGRGGTSTYLI